MDPVTETDQKRAVRKVSEKGIFCLKIPGDLIMERRKDNRGRVLKEGESQRKDGLYQYRWQIKTEKRKYIYA